MLNPALIKWHNDNYDGSTGLMNYGSPGRASVELIQLTNTLGTFMQSDQGHAGGSDCEKSVELEDTLRNAENVLSWLQQSRNVLLDECSVSVPSLPNMTLSSLTWAACCSLRVACALPSTRATTCSFSWTAKPNKLDSTLLSLLFIPCNDSVCNLSAHQLIACVYCLIEPMRGAQLLAECMDGVRGEIAAGAAKELVTALRLRAAELVCGYNTKGDRLSPTVYDCDIYCTDDALNARGVAVTSALCTVLSHNEGFKQRYRVKVQRDGFLPRNVSTVADRFVAWVAEEKARWLNQSTEAACRHFVHRRLLPIAADCEAVARITQQVSADRAQTLRIVRPNAPVLLHKDTYAQVASQSCRIRHWEFVYWSTVCLDVQISESQFKFYGTFCMSYEACRAGIVPNHEYPYLCELPRVPLTAVIFPTGWRKSDCLHPQKTDSTSAHVVGTFEEAFIAWLMCIQQVHNCSLSLHGRHYSVSQLCETLHLS